MREPKWVSKSVTRAIHDAQLARHGGRQGTRDEGLLESALARPKNRFFYGGESVDMAALAAAYAYGLATNHPFIDGNKRTALVISFMFLDLNGYNLTASMEDRYSAIISLAAGELSEDDLASWFRENTQPSSDNNPGQDRKSRPPRP